MKEMLKQLRRIEKKLNGIAGALEDRGFTDLQNKIDEAATPLADLIAELEDLEDEVREAA